MSRRASPSTAAAIRCAIYTRKSTEEGLDQAFNSLHAQREACEAYVLSQAGEGWTALKTIYDDGGFSGGNMERPALRRLLADIAAGKVDTVVVYKVDRLTRSLPDFAKIVDSFDAQKVSFVSVTQAFNTTTSMGRLTLNVLLSFAQFEREVTGERIRDKIAASKAKGMWMGGVPPLGYGLPTDLKTRQLIVAKPEAEVVQTIFEQYLSLGSVAALERWLNDQGIRSKAWTTRQGEPKGGIKFSRGALYALLKNRLYLGEILHRGKTVGAGHPAIITPELFDRVQTRLASGVSRSASAPRKTSSALLTGRIFDSRGQAMTPTYTRNRHGAVYRYYVSTALQRRGRRPDQSQPQRIPAAALDELVGQVVERVAPGSSSADKSSVTRVAVYFDEVHIVLSIAAFKGGLGSADGFAKRAARELEADARVAPEGGSHIRIVVPAQLRTRGGRAWLTRPDGRPTVDRKRPDLALIKALKAAQLLQRKHGLRPTEVALDAQAPASPYDMKLLRLAFLSPKIQQAILAGDQPAGLTLERLMQVELPLAWLDQERLILA